MKSTNVQVHFQAVMDWMAVQAVHAEEDADRLKAVMDWLYSLPENPSNDEKALTAFVAVESRQMDSTARAKRMRQAIEVLRGFHQ